MKKDLHPLITLPSIHLCTIQQLSYIKLQHYFLLELIPKCSLCSALEYFKLLIIESVDHPIWMDNWDAFVQLLQQQFGHINPAKDAESRLDHLWMQDNQHIIKYIINFNTLMIWTGLNGTTLHHRYYSRLAEQIKDIMSQQGKPSTLNEMKTLAHSINARHWEQQWEKSRSGIGKSDDKPDRSDKGKSNDKGTRASLMTRASQMTRASLHRLARLALPTTPTATTATITRKTTSPANLHDLQSSGSRSSRSSSSLNPLTDKLGKYGKLTPEQQQQCFTNNLWMFCRGAGHIATDCNIAKAVKVKARSTLAKEKDPSAGGSKKVWAAFIPPCKLRAALTLLVHHLR